MLTGNFYFTHTASGQSAKENAVINDNPVFISGKVTVDHGSIMIDTRISGDLYLDGEKLGYLRANSTGNQLNKIKTGAHTVKIVGSETQTREITVYKDHATTVIFKKEIDYTEAAGIFTDSRNNKEYKWIRIGDQVWMAENLNYKTAYGNWCYDNKESNCNTYGRLYNWETAKKVCPDGWHLPTDKEWKELERQLGMSKKESEKKGYRGTDEGGKLKETSLTHWSAPNKGATNESGFTALPGGYRNYVGAVGYIGSSGLWWSATERNATNAWNRGLRYAHATVTRYGSYKTSGFSVRCLRD